MESIENDGILKGKTGEFIVTIKDGKILSAVEKGEAQFVASLDEFFYVAELAGYAVSNKKSSKRRKEMMLEG